MLKVDADSVEAYLAFDPARREELEKFDGAMRSFAPRLERYFHAGTAKGEPGMRFRMIGYGPFRYATSSGRTVLWPAVGIALQKNYVSAYFAPRGSDGPVTAAYTARLGAVRCGEGNFSFTAFNALDGDALAGLLAEAQRLFETVPASLAHFGAVEKGLTDRMDRRKLALGVDRSRTALS